MVDIAADRQQSALWAYEMSKRQAWCALDTETTGLGNKAEICQIAVTNPQGYPLLNTLVKPTVPIEPEAQRIHSITNEMVQDAPTFDQVFVDLLKAVGNNEIVIYNASFDLRLIQQSLRPYGVHICFHGSDRVVIPAIGRSAVKHWCFSWLNGAPIHCAMEWYSQYCGEWSDYHGNYRWQKLPGSEHSALGDCTAVLNLLVKMAASCQREPPPEPMETVGTKLAEMPTIAATAATEEYDDIPF